MSLRKEEIIGQFILKIEHFSINTNKTKIITI